MWVKRYVIKQFDPKHKINLYVMWEEMIILFDDENQAKEFIETFHYFFSNKQYEIVEAEEVIYTLNCIQYTAVINLKTYKDALDKLGKIKEES